MFIWSEQARGDLRKIDRENAVQILHALTRWGETGVGDVKHLKGSLLGRRRLRVGDYRIRFEPRKDGRILIISVEHRKQAYRDE